MSLCAAALFLSLSLTGCDDLRALVVAALPSDYQVEDPQVGERGLVPVFDEALDGVSDGAAPVSDRIVVGLQPVAHGLAELTDIQFPPGSSDRMVVTRKGGEIVLVELSTGQARQVHRVDVPVRSEQGLLGLAFHPTWPADRRIFLNYSGPDGETRVSAWTADPPTLALTDEQLLLEVPQPYPNHNAGQLAFGPDGMLYIGLGDGGWRDDPHGHGQNSATLLGSMLRIDVDRAETGRAYGLPPDNPFLGSDTIHPEIWATGLRNPWRYSFDPQGRLVVADVGQNTWEEVDLVPRGANMGWKHREGRHCFPSGRTDCVTEGLVDPVFEYDHTVGQSITGGYVHTGRAVPALAGRYVFGDFTSGRMWALALPEQPGQDAAVWSLGKWPLLISTFGRDGAGELYVGDYHSGTVYRIVAAGSAG